MHNHTNTIPYQPCYNHTTNPMFDSNDCYLRHPPPQPRAAPIHLLPFYHYLPLFQICINPVVINLTTCTRTISILSFLVESPAAYQVANNWWLTTGQPRHSASTCVLCAEMCVANVEGMSLFVITFLSDDVLILIRWQTFIKKTHYVHTQHIVSQIRITVH